MREAGTNADPQHTPGGGDGWLPTGALPPGHPSPMPTTHLRAGPVPVLLVANLLGDMVHLCDPHEPVALQDPVAGAQAVSHVQFTAQA